MATQVHLFTLKASFGPQELFRAIRAVVDHPAQRDHAPDFEFDWIARRVALSAASEQGLAICHGRLLAEVSKLGGPPDALIPGKVEERPEGRVLRPYGVLVQEAAAFGELIGRSLVDLGLRGVQVVDKAGGVCEIRVRLNAIARRVDYAAFMHEFPLPSYIALSDEGTIEEEAPPVLEVAKPQRKRRRK